jgi:hypothetical protein
MDSRTIYVIEDDLMIVEATGHPQLTYKGVTWWIPELGYATPDVYFDPFDAMLEQTKRVIVETERLNRIIATSDGFPRAAEQRIRRVGDQRSKTLLTTGSSRHAPGDR